MNLVLDNKANSSITGKIVEYSSSIKKGRGRTIRLTLCCEETGAYAKAIVEGSVADEFPDNLYTSPLGEMIRIQGTFIHWNGIFLTLAKSFSFPDKQPKNIKPRPAATALAKA